MTECPAYYLFAPAVTGRDTFQKARTTTSCSTAALSSAVIFARAQPLLLAPTNTTRLW